jgi:protocatechuate 3,4-dioxygenase beta subunit
MMTSRITLSCRSIIFLLVGATILQTSLCQNLTDQTLFLLSGVLLNDLGKPVVGGHIQLWQTDINGNYAHPGNQYNGYELIPFGYYGTVR